MKTKEYRYIYLQVENEAQTEENRRKRGKDPLDLSGKIKGGQWLNCGIHARIVTIEVDGRKGSRR